MFTPYQNSINGHDNVIGHSVTVNLRLFRTYQNRIEHKTVEIQSVSERFTQLNRVYLQHSLGVYLSITH
ncbi:unnamed protein product [Acanthoscelides obtectus]|uniref:Uncharacterized protein n=1 Tax=Acanthoscelides obtectus TaxID=200917 RepID=A0A9P0P3K0_ACAOB|nr:unnamed protein product [Acanthoscelides obtectus]CAK1653223.1 hypothetical protein AOBTE_LOCUS18136 [Acanthoscelides obtectus]